MNYEESIPYNIATLISFAFIHSLKGIGLDDAFVITSTFRMYDNMGLNIDNRVEKCMENCGVGILVTTITDCMAFSVGYFTSSMPGIQWFYLYGAVAIAIDFFYQITFFVAVS